MGTLIILVCRFVLGFDSVGGDYQTIALTASLDTLAIIGFLTLKQSKATTR